MKRGEVWTQSGASGYASKPRPVLILQSDLLIGTDSMIICPFTSHDNEEIPTRVKVAPNAENGLREPSDLMTEKITAVPRTKLGKRLGVVTIDDMERTEEAILMVLGFAG
jgi:mRNA interferase MazF